MRGLKWAWVNFDGATTPSHPTRMRGLKSEAVIPLANGAVSHPTRMRGLKLVPRGQRAWRYVVASYTDAWIEIIAFCRITIFRSVASYTDAWIEIDK